MIENIGIIGAGQMGSGIAHVCLLAGYQVLLSDISKDALKQGAENIDRSMERQVARNKLTLKEKEEALAHLKTVISEEEFKKCDLVIEAVTENEEIKKRHI
ncbi:3-hydroxyacyl-CoA dehydrogenase NAD-binding domain-containing protein [Geitlerinema splendidum]|nr:3-hydroxyacyl-CoA dehydrogenase NAD-binding domain-containing protein [Geitlerinema splendidum]